MIKMKRTDDACVANGERRLVYKKKIYEDNGNANFEVVLKLQS